MSKKVLLTGSKGFVGLHCLEFLLENTDWQIVTLDSHSPKINPRFSKLTTRPDFNSRVLIVCHDLNKPIHYLLEKRIMERTILSDGAHSDKKINYIINLASDADVQHSVIDPIPCLRNNYDLAIHMLEFARRIQPDVFFQISTDEVYGEAGPIHAHKEWSPIVPESPYAASKAAQEAVAIAYWKSYNVPVVLVNTQNIIGEGQDPQKFLPKIIQSVATGKTVPIYATSEKSIGSRSYLHAKNLAHALVFLSKFKPANYDSKIYPDRFNVCGDVELNNLEFAKLVAHTMKMSLKYKFVQSDTGRKGYDRRYALNGAKIKDRGWKPRYTFKQSVEMIIEYILQNPHWMTK